MDDVQPQVIIGLVVLVVTVLLRLRPRPMTVRRLLIAPVIVLAVGVVSMVPLLPPAAGSPLGSLDVAVLITDVLLSVGLGVARGVTVRVERVDASLHYRYTGTTVALWAASVVLRFLLADAGAQWGAAPVVTTGSVLAMLGLSLLTQNLIVLTRRRTPVLATQP